MKWKRANKYLEEPLVDYLAKLFDETIAKGYTFDVAVGTDSQKSGKGYRFATVILISMREDLGSGISTGRGGMVIHAAYNEDVVTKKDGLKPKGHEKVLLVRGKEGVNHRMIYEVSKSIEAAMQIADLVEAYGIKMTIHADINANEKWESNKALSHAIGYILGMGYDFKIKPDAWAASFGADRFCA